MANPPLNRFWRVVVCNTIPLTAAGINGCCVVSSRQYETDFETCKGQHLCGFPACSITYTFCDIALDAFHLMSYNVLLSISQKA
jgi:hypothetical protein